MRALCLLALIAVLGTRAGAEEPKNKPLLGKWTADRAVLVDSMLSEMPPDTLPAIKALARDKLLRELPEMAIVFKADRMEMAFDPKRPQGPSRYRVLRAKPAEIVIETTDHNGSREVKDEITIDILGADTIRLHSKGQPFKLLFNRVK